MINNKLEEKLCGEGPNLRTIFEDDLILMDIEQSIQDSMQRAFEVAGDYAEKFEPFRNFYAENAALDFDQLCKEDHGMYVHMPSKHLAFSFKNLLL